jgi:hypothetical protein
LDIHPFRWKHGLVLGWCRRTVFFERRVEGHGPATIFQGENILVPCAGCDRTHGQVQGKKLLDYGISFVEIWERRCDTFERLRVALRQGERVDVTSAGGVPTSILLHKG